LLFTQPIFFAFLAVVLGLYFTLRHRAQNVLLLLASYVFYGWWDWRFLTLIWASTLIDYTCARRMATAAPQGRRGLMLVSVVANLTFLGFFKYFDFFVTNLAGLLQTLGFRPDLPTLSVVLPVGISFYTFQTMSYTLDVYLRKLEPEKNLWDFALFVAFFPQLVAGPIERAGRLLPQIRSERRVTWDDWVEGARLMLLGFVLKIVVADSVADEVDRIFGSSQELGWKTLLSGAYLFALQVYGDFAGYSKIARGTARLLGFELSVNFSQPFLSRSYPELWRRWHITLYSWLRDYVFLRMFRGRPSRMKMGLGIVFIMTLGGLWHGADWHFVFWGWLNGVVLFFYAFAPRRAPSRRSGPAWYPRAVLGVLFTFHLFCFTTVFFRAGSVSSGVEYVRRIFTLEGGGTFSSVLVPALLVVLALDGAERYGWNGLLARLPWPVRGALLASLVFACVVLGGEYVPFIYFQF
jgi:D-alanyl-lipoteichoic acid acyltransferase DltB (MBOAT superfamily)